MDEPSVNDTRDHSLLIDLKPNKHRAPVAVAWCCPSTMSPAVLFLVKNAFVGRLKWDRGLGHGLEESVLLITTKPLRMKHSSICFGVLSECCCHGAKTPQEPLAVGSCVSTALSKHRIPV